MSKDTTTSRRVGRTVEAFRQLVVDNLYHTHGQAMQSASKHDAYMALCYTVRDHLIELLAQDDRSPLRGQSQIRLLPLGRVPAGQAAAPEPALHGHDRTGSRSVGNVRPGLGGLHRPGCRAGPGQRRPGPPGGLLPRFAGHAGYSGGRLRHPLRVRHLQADLRGRLAGGEAGQVAALREPVGVPAAGRHGRGRLRRPHRDVHGRRRR